MKWHLAFSLVILSLGGLCISNARPDTIDKSSGGVLGTPLRDVAAPLRDLWLRFHENGYCAGLDTIFVFKPKGVEIWCRIKDDKSYQGFNSLIEPLQRSFQIDVYATHPSREKKAFAVEDNDPLPSLWNNGELRAYLGDPSIMRLRPQNLTDPDSSAMPTPAADPGLKRRMKLYGDDILQLTAKMEQLASDLPPLAAVAYGTDVMPDIRERARAICLDHAREAGKCAGKLADNLSHALPRASGAASSGQPQEKARGASDSPYDLALTLSTQARALGQRITGFLYPEAYTVNLSDLKDRGLIEALKAVQETVLEYQKSARNAR